MKLVRMYVVGLVALAVAGCSQTPAAKAGEKAAIDLADGQCVNVTSLVDASPVVCVTADVLRQFADQMLAAQRAAAARKAGDAAAK